MTQLMWDGLDCLILIFMKENCLDVHITKVVLEFGLLTSRYVYVCLCVCIIEFFW